MRHDPAAEVHPGLTTVRVDREELGRRAAEKLLARMNDEEDVPSVTDIGVSIVPRNSC